MYASLEDLPAELVHMILVLLGPDAIMQMHSTSRSWRAISEQRYSMFFFENLLVFVDEPGLGRLEAISQSECRKRVRKIAFSLHEPVPHPIGGECDYDGGMVLREVLTPDGQPARFQEDWRVPTVTATAAAAAVKRAMGSFENCTCVSVGHEAGSLWTSPYKGDRFGRLPVFYDKKMRRNDDMSQVSKHHVTLVMHTALRAAAAGTCISELSIEADGGFSCNDFHPAKDWALDRSRFPRMSHIQKVQIHTWPVYDILDLKTGLMSILGLFTSVKTLEISFEGSQSLSEYDSVCLSNFLIEGVQSLTLDGMACESDDILNLVRNPRAKTIRQLKLTTLDIYGGLTAWVEVIIGICNNLELTELHLIDVESDGLGILELDEKRTKESGRRMSRSSKLTYRNLGRSTISRVVGEFIKDLCE